MFRRCRLMGLLLVAPCIGAIAFVGGLVWAESDAPAEAVESDNALGPESAAVTEPVEARLWIQDVALDPSTPVRIEVAFPEQLAVGDTVVFECEVHADADLDTGTVRLEILDAAGRVLDVGEIALSVAEGAAPCKFTWTAASLPDGEYSARFDFYQTPTIILASHELDLTMISRPSMEAGLMAARKALDVLREHLNTLGTEAPDSPYLHLRLALAEDFLDQVPEVAEDWPRVREITTYAIQALNSIRSRMTFGRMHSSWSAPALAKLQVKNGTFYAGDRPVFLVGLRQDGLTSAQLDRLERYRLNFAALDAFLSDAAVPRPDLPGMLDALFKGASQRNVSISLLLDLAKGRSSDAPVSTDGTVTGPMDQNVEQFARFGIDVVAPYLEGREMLNSLGFMAVPELDFDEEKMRAAFVDRVRELYPDRFVLNRAWRTRFASFDDVGIDRDFKRSSYQYDWQTFLRNKTTQFYADLADHAGERIANLPLQFIYGAGAFEVGESQGGLAHEPLAQLFPLTGIGATVAKEDSAYSYDFATNSAVYTLRRSFAPSKPIFAFLPQSVPEAPGRRQRHFAADYVRSILWEAAIDGVSAFALDAGNPQGAFSGPILGHPAALDAFATTALDLNRLAPIVAEFQQAAAVIGILWSTSAKVYADGDPFLGSALRAFEGCSFSGVKIRFVTEAQCAAGGLAGLGFLVIPNMPALSDAAFAALQAHIETGGAVIRAATPIPYDAWGHSRNDVILYEPGTLLVRGRDSSTEYLHAMDAALYRNPGSFPRAVNAHDYPLEGVKSRYVQVDGETYLYLINLREEPAVCHLTAGYSHGRDLVSGRPVRFPLVMKPLHPMLVRLDTPETGADLPLQALEPEDAPGIPTAVVKPVPAGDGSAS